MCRPLLDRADKLVTEYAAKRVIPSRHLQIGVTHARHQDANQGFTIGW